MLRTLVGAALVLVVACGGEKGSTADGQPAAAASKADGGEASTPSAGATKDDEPGLAAAVKKAIGTKPSPNTRLIPEGAKILVGLDVAAFVEHTSYVSLRVRLGRRQREQLEASTRCGVGSDKWRTFVIGFDPESRDMAMVVEAVGVGTKSTLQCLAEAIGTFTLSEDGKTMSDHTGGGIVLNDDMIAFATPAWMGPLKDRIAGKGTAAVDGSLRAAWAYADNTRPLWFVGQAPSRLRELVRDMAGSEPSSLAGTVTLSEPVKLQMSIEFPDASAAAVQLQTQWNLLQGFVAGTGLPPTVAQSVTIGDVDGVVGIGVSASHTDVETILDTFWPHSGY